MLVSTGVPDAKQRRRGLCGERVDFGDAVSAQISAPVVSTVRLEAGSL